jgi:predicted Zn-dependent protease
MDKPRRTLALEKLASETLRTHPLRRVVIALVVVAAATFLFTLKHEGKKAQEVIAVKQAATAQERAELNEKIAERLPKQLGGPSQNKDQVALVARVAHAIATKSDASKAGITFTYHLMAEPNSINIYAASGGQIYITTASTRANSKSALSMPSCGMNTA